ncbi:MAG: peptide ABC transporter ATP-binding protein, partial [Chloroflexi bacterium]
HPPVGCNFNTRCHKVQDICHKVDPEFKEVRPGHFVACHLVDGNSIEEG